ncbi:NSE4A [Scenedesmus sp. PABB004]|nr:NSE4A [Scenedesmus sp. PABB004]
MGRGGAAQEAPLEPSMDDRRALRGRYRSLADDALGERRRGATPVVERAGAAARAARRPGPAAAPRAPRRRAAAAAAGKENLVARGGAEALQAKLRELDALHRQVSRPREHAVDAEVFAQLAECSLQLLRHGQATNQGRTPADLVRALRARFVADPLPGQGAGDVCDWASLGAEAAALHRRGPGLGCMLGPLAAEAKARKQGVRRAKRAADALERPAELQGGEEGEAQETDRNMEAMWAALRRRGGGALPVVQLVCSHASFAETVENVFTLSFLVRDQRVRLLPDTEAGLQVQWVSEADKAGAPAPGGDGAGQFVMALTMQDWQLMKALVPPGVCVMPHRPAAGARARGAEGSPAAAAAAAAAAARGGRQGGGGKRARRSVPSSQAVLAPPPAEQQSRLSSSRSSGRRSSSSDCRGQQLQERRVRACSARPMRGSLMRSAWASSSSNGSTRRRPAAAARAAGSGVRRAAAMVVRCETTAQRVARALGYPYPRPDRSFVFVNGGAGGPAALTFNDSDWQPPAAWGGSLEPLLGLRVTGPGGAAGSLADALATRGVAPRSALPPGAPLTPILAIGSNAGPEQLARKFPGELFPDGVVVPVVQCVLRGFDVVYAPLISSYGSATATLEASPGTDVAVFVTYLTPALQQRMHETEGAYNLCRLDGVTLLEGISLQAHLDGAAPAAVASSAFNYNHQHGSLHMDFANPGRSPVALAEIAAHGRSLPALSQAEMQAALRAALRDVAEGGGDGDGAAAPGPSSDRRGGLRQLPSLQHGGDGAEAVLRPAAAELDAWVLSNLDRPGLRKARVAALTAAAEPFGYAQAEVLLTLGTALSTSVK